jgi:UDP-GlcNAc3NAcA epimerase
MDLKARLKIATIVGARPQFIKAAPVNKALQEAGHTECLVHTGQHYDYELSQVFFDELEIPKPHYNLEVGSGSHGRQTGELLGRIEEVLVKEQPDWVLVYGDTNSTLAGALASAKLHIPIAHVEAGERNFTPDMHIVHPSTIPEEVNRVLTDHLSTLLFCATNRAVENLRHEGIDRGVYKVGDVTLDIFLTMSRIAQKQSTIIHDLELNANQYVLATVHRALNTECSHRMAAIISTFSEIEMPVVFPIHPRTLKAIRSFGLENQLAQSPTIHKMNPVGYLDMLELERNARLIITDSGGVMREAYFFSVPSVLLDDTTEWIDLVKTGWSTFVELRPPAIKRAVIEAVRPAQRPLSFGNGDASKNIVKYLEEWSKA